jgi:hypothetical protein
MAYAALEVLAGKVREDLERFFQNRRSGLREHLGGLLTTLLTAEAPESLAHLAAGGEARGLPTHLRRLEKYLQGESRLPEAICARYHYKVPEHRARRRYRVAPRAWAYVHALVKELDWNPDIRVGQIAYESFPWHDELEKRHVEMEVFVESQALEGMLLSALEAYLSPRGRRRKGYEVYGLAFGMVRQAFRRKVRHGITITRYVSLTHAQPQLSADGDAGGVAPNPRSLQAILAAMSTLYPQCQAVGDFHSHPYDALALLEDRRGWKSTASDEGSNIVLAQGMTELGHRMHVSLVVAVARTTQKVVRGHYRGLRNTVQMNLGKCRVIVAGYRSLASGRLTDTNIRLRLSGIAS